MELIVHSWSVTLQTEAPSVTGLGGPNCSQSTQGHQNPKQQKSVLSLSAEGVHSFFPFLKLTSYSLLMFLAQEQDLKTEPFAIRRTPGLMTSGEYIIICLNDSELRKNPFPHKENSSWKLAFSFLFYSHCSTAKWWYNLTLYLRLILYCCFDKLPNLVA